MSMDYDSRRQIGCFAIALTGIICAAATGEVAFLWALFALFGA